MKKSKRKAGKFTHSKINNEVCFRDSNSQYYIPEFSTTIGTRLEEDIEITTAAYLPTAALYQ